MASMMPLGTTAGARRSRRSLASTGVSPPSDGESRDGVPLTNLDQPLFDGPARPSATSSTTSTPCATGSSRCSRTGRCRSSGSTAAKRRSCRRTSRSTRRTGCATVHALGRDVEARRAPTRSATTAARCCGSPTSGPSSTTRRWCRPSDPTTSTHLVLDLDPPEGDAFPMAVARRPPRPPGARPTSVWRARSRRAAPRACTCSSRSTTGASIDDAAAATRAIAARAERARSRRSPRPRS